MGIYKLVEDDPDRHLDSSTVNPEHFRGVSRDSQNKNPDIPEWKYLCEQESDLINVGIAIGVAAAGAFYGLVKAGKWAYFKIRNYIDSKKYPEIIATATTPDLVEVSEDTE